MNFLQIIGKMFGNKYEKDVKNIMPTVDKINTIFAEFQTITNDQLRKNTQDLKNQISNSELKRCVSIVLVFFH